MRGMVLDYAACIFKTQNQRLGLRRCHPKMIEECRKESVRLSDQFLT